MKAAKTKTGPTQFLTLLRKEFSPTAPVERQIVSHLGELIQKRKIPVGTKLPSIRALAELWNTNYFTAHRALNQLAGQGYILLRPVTGSFVAGPRRGLRRVCLYRDGRINSWSTGELFYLILHIILSARLIDRGIEIVPFFDSRPWNKLHTIPSQLKKMAVDGEIDAVIATEILPTKSQWLYTMELPLSSLMLEQEDRKIEIDILDMASKVIAIAVQSKRTRIGLIHREINEQLKGRPTDILKDELERLAARKGISIFYVKRPYTDADMHPDRTTALVCEELLKLEPRPDMIFVFPDIYMPSVANVLNRQHIEVPQEILVVSHRNAEIKVYVPFPMIWLTVAIEDFAKRLIEQLDWQIEKKQQISTLIPIHVEKVDVPELPEYRL